MTIIIHKVDASPAARAVLMTAELLKLNHHSKDVDFKTGDHIKPEYLDKNPLHTVPLLEDGNFYLADSHAIVTYLVSKYGGGKQAELYPNDLELRATIDQRLYFDATILYQRTAAVTIEIYFKNSTGPNEEQTKKIIEAYDVLEKYLQKTKFVACDHMTIADIACVSTLSTMNVLVPVDKKYAKVHAWWNKLKGEEWYQKANVPGLEQITSLLTGLIQKHRA